MLASARLGLSVLAVFSGRLAAPGAASVFAAGGGVAAPLSSGQIYRYPLGAVVVEEALFSTGSGNSVDIVAHLFKNGVATGLDLTLPAGAVGQVANGTGRFIFGPTDTLDVILVNNGGLAADFVWSLTLRGRLL